MSRGVGELEVWLRGLAKVPTSAQLEMKLLTLACHNFLTFVKISDYHLTIPDYT